MENDRNFYDEITYANRVKKLLMLGNTKEYICFLKTKYN